MNRSTRILIVGSDHTPEICARLLTHRFATKHAHIDQLATGDIHWSESILVLDKAHRRLIANRFPSEYLLRRVVHLDVSDASQEAPRIESRIREQLIAHGLIPNE